MVRHIESGMFVEYGGPGPPYGSLNPVGYQEWISLPPHEHETSEQWRARAGEHIERLGRFITAIHASSLMGPVARLARRRALTGMGQAS